MIKVQKIIKYCAVAFAVLLIFNIITTVIFGIMYIGNIFSVGNFDDDYIMDSLETLKINNSDIKGLDIEVTTSNIIIKEGTSLKLETNNKYIKLKEKNNKILITEDNHGLVNNTDSILIIYVPNGYIFDDLSIDSGAGKLQIDSINIDRLDLDLGAGKVEIGNLNVSIEADIDGGAGEIAILSGVINNLDLSIGVGKFALSSRLNGNNEIEAGVGAVELNLVGTIDDYKVKVNKGFGNVTLNGENIENDIYYGNGLSLIDIDGGVGNININYLK